MTMPKSTKGPQAPSQGFADPMAALDLSWAKAFHTVNIVRWSEPPGPGGFECATWRVMVGAFGTYVSSNHADLQAAINDVLQRAESDPVLSPLIDRGQR